MTCLSPAILPRLGLHRPSAGVVHRRGGAEQPAARLQSWGTALPVEILAQIASQTQGPDLEALCLGLMPLYGESIRASLYHFVAKPFRQAMQSYLGYALDDFTQVVAEGLPANILQALSFTQRRALLSIALTVGIDTTLVKQLRGTDHTGYLRHFETLADGLLSAIPIDDEASAFGALNARLSHELRHFAAFCRCPPDVTEAQTLADPMLPMLIPMRDAQLRACAQEADELCTRLQSTSGNSSLHLARRFAHALSYNIDNTRSIMVDVQRGPRGR